MIGKPSSVAIAECEPAHFLFPSVGGGFGIEPLYLGLFLCAGSTVVCFVGFSLLPSKVHLSAVFVWSRSSPVAWNGTWLELGFLFAHGFVGSRIVVEWRYFGRQQV